MTTTATATAWISKCPYCSKIERVEAASVLERNRAYSVCPCTKTPGFSYAGHRPRFVSFRAIKATYKADVVCTATCTNAKTEGCTCSCGGENHGTAHAHRGILL